MTKETDGQFLNNLVNDDSYNFNDCFSNVFIFSSPTEFPYLKVTVFTRINAAPPMLSPLIFSLSLS